VSPLRWVAVNCFALAIVGRLARHYVSFDFAVAVAPGVHRTILPPGVLFWGLLTLGVFLATARDECAIGFDPFPPRPS